MFASFFLSLWVLIIKIKLEHVVTLSEMLVMGLDSVSAMSPSFLAAWFDQSSSLIRASGSLTFTRQKRLAHNTEV